jgi:hypothetical protein
MVSGVLGDVSGGSPEHARMAATPLRDVLQGVLWR